MKTNLANLLCLGALTCFGSSAAHAASPLAAPLDATALAAPSDDGAKRRPFAWTGKWCDAKEVVPECSQPAGRQLTITQAGNRVTVEICLLGATPFCFTGEPAEVVNGEAVLRAPADDKNQVGTLTLTQDPDPEPDGSVRFVLVIDHGRGKHTIRRRFRRMA